MNMQQALHICAGLRLAGCIDQYNDMRAKRGDYIQARVNELCDDGGWCDDAIVTLVNSKNDALIDCIQSWREAKPCDITPRVLLEEILATVAREQAVMELNEYEEASL